MQILVFQTGGVGDVFIAQGPGAEGLKKKYPNCHLSWATDVREAMCFLQRNPYIDQPIQWLNHEAPQNYRAYRADLKIQLYWWGCAKNIVEGFLEDLGVLGHVQPQEKVYTSEQDKQSAALVIQPLKALEKPIIAIQNDIGRPFSVPGGGGGKWHPHKVAQLIELLQKNGCSCIELGISSGFPYTTTAEIIRNCDVFIGCEGSIAHVAAAVGTQTITLRSIYDPKLTMAAETQNQFVQDEKKKHIILHPKRWCNDYNLCMVYRREATSFGLPPGVSNKFAPYMHRSCPYYAQSCIHEIDAQDVCNITLQTLKARGLL